MNALARLLAPLPLEDFYARHWRRRWCHVAGDPARLPAWLGDPSLRDLSAWGRAFQGVGFVQRASHAHPVDMRYPGGDGRPEVLYAMGLTQGFPAMQRHVAGCAAWLDALCAALDVAPGMFDAHLFVSPPGEGLRWHFDACDTFVVQLRGAKRWHLAENRHARDPVGPPCAPGMRPAWQHLAQTAAALPDRDPDDVEALTLAPGSVLFLPRGVWHRTDACDEGSVSVSLSSRVPTLGECVLRQLEAALAQVPAMRAPAYGIAGDLAARDALRGALDGALAQAPAALAALSGASVLAQCAPEGAPLDRSTRMYRDPTTRVAVSTADDGALRVTTDVSELMIDGRRGDVGAMTCDEAAAPLLAWISARRGVFSAGELVDAFGDVDAGDALALLGSLRDVGALSVCPFPRVDVDCETEAPGSPQVQVAGGPRAPRRHGHDATTSAHYGARAGAAAVPSTTLCR